MEEISWDLLRSPEITDMAVLVKIKWELIHPHILLPMSTDLSLPPPTHPYCLCLLHLKSTNFLYVCTDNIHHGKLNFQTSRFAVSCRQRRGVENLRTVSWHSSFCLHHEQAEKFKYPYDAACLSSVPKPSLRPFIVPTFKIPSLPPPHSSLSWPFAPSCLSLNHSGPNPSISLG